MSKSILKRYGAAGLAAYTGISVISFGSWFTAISLGLDTNKIIDSIKSTLNFPVEAQPPQIECDQNHQIKAQEFQWKTLGTNLIMTVAAHNLIFPVRLGLTLYLTPLLGRALKAKGLFNKI